MYKKLLSILLTALLLCGCNGQSVGTFQSEKAANNSCRQVPETGELTVQLLGGSPADAPRIEWGEYSDDLKKFADHDGSINFYRDYIMTIQFMAENVQSKKLPLSADILGSQFLTNIQKMNVIAERPPQPQDDEKLILTVTDSGKKYKYIFYANGQVYTIQNEKIYYIEESAFQFSAMRLRFINAALEEGKAPTPSAGLLPDFDPVNGKFTFNEAAAKPDYSAEEYNAAIIFNDYGNYSAPVVIRSNADKTQIFDALNFAEHSPKYEQLMGGNIIIRIFNDKNCFNYTLSSNQLIDYQSGLSYSAPDSLQENINMAVAYELAKSLPARLPGSSAAPT